jgi:hypothetical protein
MSISIPPQPARHIALKNAPRQFTDKVTCVSKGSDPLSPWEEVTEEDQIRRFQYTRNGNDGILAKKLINGNYVNWVYSKRSTLNTPGNNIDAGIGLFAGREFQKNDIIGYYCGEITEDEHDRMDAFRKPFDNGQYLMKKTETGKQANGYTCSRRDYVLETTDFTNEISGVPDALLPLINSNPSAKKNNVRFMPGPGGHGFTGQVKAKTAIQTGQELFLDYGKDFFSWNTAPSTTEGSKKWLIKKWDKIPEQIENPTWITTQEDFDDGIANWKNEMRENNNNVVVVLKKEFFGTVLGNRLSFKYENIITVTLIQNKEFDESVSFTIPLHNGFPSLIHEEWESFTKENSVFVKIA